jgi:Ser/Thr protein kinase RdoA (MazF antagonist)
VCHLAVAGVPVVMPVVTDDAGLAAQVDGRQFVLLPWVESDATNHEVTPDAAVTSRSIGEAIGRLDAALANCPWLPRSFLDDPARDVLVEALPKVPEVADLVAPLRDRLWTAVIELPTQLTHGDCNTGNVLVHQRRVRAFLDLDHLPIGPRVRDLSYYLASRLRSHFANPATALPDADAWVAQLGNYLEGYHDSYPLSERELAAVVPLIILTEIGCASWSLHGWVPDPARYDLSVRTIAWLMAHVDELTDAAALPARNSAE